MKSHEPSNKREPEESIKLSDSERLRRRRGRRGSWRREDDDDEEEAEALRTREAVVDAVSHLARHARGSGQWRRSPSLLRV